MLSEQRENPRKGAKRTEKGGILELGTGKKNCKRTEKGLKRWAFKIDTCKKE
jgi:hypothetical protein